MNKLEQATLEALVVALLAVNQYSLEKAWALREGLGREGFMTPERIVGADIGDLTVRLARAGYNRGLLTEMFAHRLQSLMVAVEQGTLDSLVAHIDAGKKDSAIELLTSVKGIGPKVAATAWMLLAE